TPSVISGRNQDAALEADLEYAEQHGIQVFHRLTGGGAVYHDPGNVNCTVFSDMPGEDAFSLKKLAEPVAEAVRTVLPEVHFGGRNDLLTGDGRKICGTAARIDGTRVLFHCCINYDVDMEVMEHVLTPSVTKLERHAVRSVKSRTVRLREFMPDTDTDAFMDLMERELLRIISGEKI
ncbi:MAG: lipoate--protein ligase family protein, partial [Lachnospiraceae bacterium]|nr:lipoate--protein ligase family protein [Lachnospiraceae bacterium]